MSTHLMAQLAELRISRDDADVTLNCQGEVIKAHSFILGTRSEYFKTALKTSIGNNNKVIKVNECSPLVLAAAVDFIYGIEIPGDFGSEDAKSLLAMADLYLMEDLKDAVGSLIATKHTNKNNILKISQMAEKYRAQKLSDVCYAFIFQNLKTLDKKLLMELFETLPLLGEMAWMELIEGTPHNSVDIAKTVLGINEFTHFKKRVDFQSDDEYKGYMMTHTKPNMLVLCNVRSYWGGNDPFVPRGTIGRVLRLDMDGPTVKWQKFKIEKCDGYWAGGDEYGLRGDEWVPNGYRCWEDGKWVQVSDKSHRGSFLDLNLLTPPIETSIFND